MRCLALRACFLLPGLGAALGAPASGQGAEVQGDLDAILGPGFEVLGERVTPADLKRAIVVGARGRDLLEAAKLQVFVDEQLERFGRELAPEERQEAAADSGAQQRLFDRVFLPEDPREYPQRTEDALNQSAPDFVQRLIDGHVARLAAEERARALGEEPMPVDQEGKAMFQDVMRSIVIRFLVEAAEVKTFLDGIPPEAALVVNGRVISTEEVWRAIRPRVRADDVEEVRAWLERTIAARKALAAHGAYLDDAAFAEAWETHAAPAVPGQWSFDVEAVAVGFRKFPSLEHYKVHFRLQESYRRMIDDELTDAAALQKHLEGRAGELLGLAKVEVEVILIPAYDFEIDAYRENGWEDAGQLAIECMRELAAGASWDATLDKYSDWYEPPVAKSPASAASFSKNKGRFGLKNRNELLQQLGESDWTQFLTGNTVTDYIFFDLEVGLPSQPLRGPHGYYIAKVKRRSGPSSPVDLRQRALIEQGYVNTRFNVFCQEQVDRLHGGK